MDYLARFFYNFISGIISKIPTGSIPEQAKTSFQNVIASLKYFSNFLALDTLFFIIKMTLGIILIFITINLALWIYSLIKGGG